MTRTIKTKNIILILLFVFCISSCESGTEIEKPKGIIANAGEDITIPASSYVVFDASKSFLGENPDYNKLWLEWIQDENNPAEVNLFSGDNLTRVVGFIKEGTYKFRLVINSDTDTSDSDEVIITVLPREESIIEDPYLESHVRYQIKKQKGKLTETDLLNIDTLGTYNLPLGLHNIVSLKGVEYCKNTEYMQFNLESIEDISPLKDLTELKYLTINQNNILSDITPLEALTNIEHLDIETNNIADITPIRNLTKLKYLNIMYNEKIEDISIIANFYTLKELLLSGHDINNINAVKDLTGLTLLWASKCNLIDISSISKLNNLDYLYLCFNSINNIQYLKNMNKLRKLYLSTNEIEDISVLEFLPSIQYIELVDNRIVDILPLVKNENINEGDEVYLMNNPLSEKSINEYIPQLLGRGVFVAW